jgi:hypothetical protein
MSDIALSLQYLSACSEESLEAFELSRLNRASNLRKELSQVAEEWVDAEVSFRLARVLVDRRRADPRVAKPQSRRALGPASRSQLTLQLPSPCEPPVVDARNDSAATASIDSQTRANCEESDSAHSTERAPGPKRKNAAMNETPRSTRRRIPRTPTDVIAAVPGFELPRTVDAVPSVQAATELRALNAAASGPPEMHPNPPRVTTAPLLRFRFGFRAASPKIA